MKLYQIMIVLMAVAFVACEKEEVDNAAPQIEVANPIHDAAYHPGDTIHFECTFTDNEQLKSYKIDIHFAGDHEHKSVSITNNEWQYENTWDFQEGVSSEYVTHSEIVIPETVVSDGMEEEITEGEYHFGVYCTDLSGNESQEFVDIIIEHDDHDHE